MDGVECAERRRERIVGAAEHGRGHVYAIHPLEEAQDQTTAIRKVLSVEKSLAKASIERSQALHLGEGAHDRPFPPADWRPSG